MDVLRIGLVPQDLEAIMREAQCRERKKYELCRLRFLEAVASRRGISPPRTCSVTP